ncbi:protein BNIP5-like [Pelobates fuscus]|uniref:protein BNIP5-like n=1 Tax=Pelobates fuscus TaxID=191477 RepID=UPI002FE4E742
MDKANRFEKGSKRRATFMTLNNEEAKKVLEIYVKRSLSNCDEKTRKELKSRKVHRSASDFSKSVVVTSKTKLYRAKNLQETEELKKEEQTVNLENGTLEPSQDVNESTDHAKCTQTVKQSWFKNLFGQLFKKKDDKKNDKHMHRGEKTVPDMCCVFEDQVTCVEDATPQRKASKKIGLQRSSIRRAFSFKKHTSEDVTGGLTADGLPGKLKRPTHLPLTCINRPSSGKDKKNTDCYYQKVSAEIELIVKESDKPDERKSVSGESNCEATEDNDELIKKIVSILRKQGDEWNSKMKEDPTINRFFRNISYNSFKQLADVYVDKEVKNRAADATPEDLQFAYSVHLTAQVAGISSHSVNRIMGFGTQYLQDVFTRYSCGKKWDSSVDSTACISPD